MKGFGRIYISNSELEKLKKIGEGNDAIVYDAGKGILYKVYKEETMYNNINLSTKIYRKSDKNKKYIEKILYLDKDGVKIYYKDAFKRIIKRGQNIKLSKLPIGSLYIDGIFRGSVFKKINGFQLHKVFPMFSKKTKIRILREIIEEVKELTNNYIYPIDTNNSPHVDRHSNILINYKLKPELIDLDGNSTLYRETFDIECYYNTLTSLNKLFIELLEENEVSEDMHYLDIELLKKRLIKRGINSELADKISIFEADYDELENFAKLYLKIK